jgi:hypothetical protein
MKNTVLCGGSNFAPLQFQHRVNRSLFYFFEFCMVSFERFYSRDSKVHQILHTLINEAELWYGTSRVVRSWNRKKSIRNHTIDDWSFCKELALLDRVSVFG